MPCRGRVSRRPGRCDEWTRNSHRMPIFNTLGPHGCARGTYKRLSLWSITRWITSPGGIKCCLFGLRQAVGVNARPSPRDSGSPNPKGSVRPESNGHGRCIRTKCLPLRRPSQRSAFRARREKLCTPFRREWFGRMKSCFRRRVHVLQMLNIPCLTPPSLTKVTTSNAKSYLYLYLPAIHKSYLQRSTIYHIRAKDILHPHLLPPAVHRSHPHQPEGPTSRTSFFRSRYIQVPSQEHPSSGPTSTRGRSSANLSSSSIFVSFLKFPQCERSEPLFPNNHFLKYYTVPQISPMRAQRAPVPP